MDLDDPFCHLNDLESWPERLGVWKTADEGAERKRGESGVNLYSQEGGEECARSSSLRSIPTHPLWAARLHVQKVLQSPKIVLLVGEQASKTKCVCVYQKWSQQTDSFCFCKMLSAYLICSLEVTYTQIVPYLLKWAFWSWFSGLLTWIYPV